MNFGASKAASGKPSVNGDQTPISRRSSGFEQFYAMLLASPDLSILDMSGASQANISIITGAGHKMSSDDIIGAMHQFFGDDFLENQQAASNAQRFLETTLTFPTASFDGALAWDALQFISSPLIELTIAELLRVVRPGGLILAFFNSSEKITHLPLYNYRIRDAKNIMQIPRGGTQRCQYFNNRTIEKLFEPAAAVKFFLTRDNLREVLIRR